MVTSVGLLYVAGVTVLFFFWAYGIVSFARDLRSKIIPGVRQYLAGRREKRKAAEAEREREERERQLY